MVPHWVLLPYLGVLYRYYFFAKKNSCLAFQSRLNTLARKLYLSIDTRFINILQPQRATMSSSEKLKKFRNLRKTEFNRMQEIAEVAVNAKTDSNLQSLLKARYQDVDAIKTEFFKVHNSVISLLEADDDQFDVEDLVRKEFEQNVYIVRSVWFQLETVEAIPPTTDTSKSQIRLPKIELQTFSGEITTFNSFLQMYNTVIHQSKDLSSIEKFNYLISSLRGEALSVVEHIPVTANNYNVAYDVLIKRYKNDRQALRAHWNAIENTVKVNADNPLELRNLLDTFTKNLKAINNFKLPKDLSDFILVQMLFKRLDIATITRFELHHNSTDMPTYETLTKFLEQNCSALDNIIPSLLKANPKKIDINKASTSSSRSTRTVMTLMSNKSVRIKCFLCKGDHTIYKCTEFLNKSPSERYQLVKNNHMCLNCLSSTHSVKDCKSSFHCHKCKQRHHTLLHFENFGNTSNISNSSDASISNSSTSKMEKSSLEVIAQPTVTNAAGFSSSKFEVLLATARVGVSNGRGIFVNQRILLDSGSQTSFITQKAVQQLGLIKKRKSIVVQGLGQQETLTNMGSVDLIICPVSKNDVHFFVEAIVLPKICNNIPSKPISSHQWSHLQNTLPLADPEFDVPQPVSILLGADIFSQVFSGHIVKGNAGEPDALQTAFGYVFMGKVQENNLALPPRTTLCSTIDSDPLESLVNRLWELEAFPDIKVASPEDSLCESLYKKTYRRTEKGRFIVSLPFHNNKPHFLHIRDLAVTKFLSLERRLLRQPHLYSQYKKFMQDYLDLHHMELVSENTISSQTYYLPHHCITKPSSLTTKLRVVFNASAHLPNQASLNDHLYTGPKLQKDIVTILLRLRLHRIVITADIKMMYRQILLENSDRDYQRIIWRFSPQHPVQDYRLSTVTYGLNCSPYLAIRTLLQLANDDGSAFPLAAKALQEDTYMDDIVTGASNLLEAEALKFQMISLLEKGGFELRKWASNEPSLLSDLPVDHLSLDSLMFDQDATTGASIKLLGLHWHPTSDTFQFKVEGIREECTKRILLSTLARVFDPLGMLSPTTFLLKHLIQKIWSVKLDWDEKPPHDILRLWQKYKLEIPALNEFSLPRLIVPNRFLSCDLHGFGDSSEKGYGAVVYIVFTLESGERISFFLCSKSRVAPLKPISIPRLELCAAVLLTRLINFVVKVYKDKLPISRIYAWSDSTVTLYWIKSSPQRWKTFVCNRISFIQEHIPTQFWHFVPSAENPADIVSRGLLPKELLQNALWWAGPPFLKTYEFPTHNDFKSHSVTIEEQRIQTLTVILEEDFLSQLIERISSLNTIFHIVAYVLRFIYNLRNSSTKKIGCLISSEIHHAMMTLVKNIQSQHFAFEISMLKQNKRLPKYFIKLSPFLDEKGILRVGGRLSQSISLAYDRKFPALLPSRSKFTELLIENTHIKYFHAGHQTILSIISQQFWIVSAKRAIRRVLSKCLRCWRTRPTPLQPPMASLPRERISPSKPFLHSGVDFAGPFIISLSKTRGAKTMKAYLCLFICFATKALHLEIASDLTASAFLAALRRFVARRGRVQHLYSDCGTNFVSAYRQLNKLMETAAETEAISWHFNPASAPHFGGLWEAGVKSVKGHLLRTIGHQIFSYEELSTLVTEVEAMLNSRPLTPVSSDPNDLQALTPAHFLISEPLVALPDQDYSDVPINRLTRWQLVQGLFQHIWSRWSNEYLHTLHQRVKWNNYQKNLEVGTLVLIKNELCSPLRWPLGRVVATHPGCDGVVRVATVRTASSLFKRPVVKLCPLPIDS